MAWKAWLKRILRLKNLLPVSLVAVLSAVFLRIVQLAVAIDPSTGFFSKHKALIPLLVILILGYLGYVVAVLAVHPLTLTRPYRPKRMFLSAVIVGIAGIILTIEGLVAIFGGSVGSSGGNPFRWLAVLLQLAFGMVLFYQGVLFYQNRKRTVPQHLLMVVFPIWALFHLVDFFVRNIAVVNLSSYVLDLFFSVWLVIFALYYARFTAGEIAGWRKTLLTASAFSTAILGAVSVIPPMLFKLLGQHEAGQYGSSARLSALVLTVFAAWMAFLFVEETLLVAAWRRKKSVSFSTDCGYQHETVKASNLSLKKRG